MLLGEKQSEIKQVAVVTRDQQFNRLLSSVLAEWKFIAVEDPTEAKVVFAEQGIDLPDIPGEVVWLTPRPLSEDRYLTTPISLTRLYKLLETEYFPTSRRHIRVAIEVRADVCLDSVWQECQLISISDRGGRIVCQNEVQRGTMLRLETNVAGKFLQLPAEVLYCLPAGDVLRSSRPQIGVLFKPTDDRVIDMLRCHIEKICVAAACAREGIPLTDSCLSWIDLVDDPWTEVT